MIKLICDSGETFGVIREYISEEEGSVFRAFSFHGGYLSQATGKTEQELIHEVEGIEEVRVLGIFEMEGDIQ